MEIATKTDKKPRKSTKPSTKKPSTKKPSTKKPSAKKPRSAKKPSAAKPQAQANEPKQADKPQAQANEPKQADKPQADSSEKVTYPKPQQGESPSLTTARFAYRRGEAGFSRDEAVEQRAKVTGGSALAGPLTRTLKKLVENGHLRCEGDLNDKEKARNARLFVTENPYQEGKKKSRGRPRKSASSNSSSSALPASVSEAREELKRWGVSDEKIIEAGVNALYPHVQQAVQQAVQAL